MLRILPSRPSSVLPCSSRHAYSAQVFPGDRIATFYTHLLYRYSVDTYVSYYTYVSYKITERTRVLVCICQSVYSVYVSTYNSAHVCVYVCICVCVYEYTRHHVPLPSSPPHSSPLSPSTHTNVMQSEAPYMLPNTSLVNYEKSPTFCEKNSEGGDAIERSTETCITPHVYCLLHEASPMP